MNNLTKSASLPGSGGGCMSALPAETSHAKPKPKDRVVWSEVVFEVGKPMSARAQAQVAHGYWVALQRNADMLDAAGGGE